MTVTVLFILALVVLVLLNIACIYQLIVDEWWFYLDRKNDHEQRKQEEAE